MRLSAAFLNFLVLLVTCLVSGSMRLIRNSVSFLMSLISGLIGLLMCLMTAFLNFLVLLLTCLVSSSVRLIRGSIGFLMLVVKLFIYRSMSFLPFVLVMDFCVYGGLKRLL